MSIDRRQFPRVQISAEVRLTGPLGSAIGILRDTSLGGAAVVVQQAIAKLGDPIELQIYHKKEGYIPLLGKIIRVQAFNPGHLYCVKFDRDANTVMYEYRKNLDKAQDDTETNSRKYPRVSNRLTIATTYPYEGSALLDNISMGGLSVFMDRPVELDEEFEVAIASPSTKELLTLKGRVVYQIVLGDKQPPEYKMGLEFKALSKEQHEQLLKLIQELI